MIYYSVFTHGMPLKEFINEISIALISKNTVDLILLLFTSVHRVTRTILAKKLLGKEEKNILNGSIPPLLVTLIEVMLFLT